MLKAILADDEPMIIRGLRKLIPWEELGVQIIGEAWTGKSLMSLVEAEKPDLVISDISMPDDTGIDVIKEIHRRQLPTKVIFISAFQEFSYAKDALAYGAVDYLVKPIEKSLLISAVQKAITQLNEENEERSSKGKLAVYEQKDKKTQLEDLFDRLTEGDIRSEEAERRLEALKADFASDTNTVVLIEVEQLQSHTGSWGEHEKRLLLFAMTNLADELIHQKYKGWIIRKSDRLCAIINHPFDADLFALAEDMVDKIKLYLKIAVTVGMGTSIRGLGHIQSSYDAAQEALSLSYFTGGGRALSESVTGEEAKEREGEQNPAKLKQAVTQALLMKEEGKVLEALGPLFESISRSSKWNKQAAVTSCYTFLLELTEELTEMGIPASIKREPQELLQCMHEHPRFEGLKAWVTKYILDVLEQIKQSGGSKEIHQMKLVKEYIEQNFKENLSLDSMASMVFMNPYYFSSFFKKHTNQNFKQYVTEVRMKEAVKLLLQTDLMVYEIAEQVGYNNARQFSDMFKKQFGKLPQEYKNMSQNK
ncbi:response regulator [Paenibacillus rigui]|uniref:AraC family transcriptional regulator n=1 Tax=Paenibacillus rigui TaxID=554312 RepID=A0A229US39_9BACL|nr:response regulator [Paenibacillus rigui]OXM85729.1 AraC family transcriptional regulator [Paenibacillus rigui]